MQKRLVVLLGSSFGENLVKGLVRNRYSVLWHHDGPLKASFRECYSGIDWICSGQVQNHWSELVAENLVPEKDRWIVAAEVVHGESFKSVECLVPVGYLPWPLSLRQLITVLNVQSHEGEKAFRKAWETTLDEWHTMEKAKKAIMGTMSCTEPEAYRHLRRLSMDRCKPIAVIAQTILKQ